MARQPVARGLALLALAASCQSTDDYVGAHQLPVALGVLHPETGGPFTEPIGFVGSQEGGRISLLALKQGRYLTDDPAAAFLRTNSLATGGGRVLTSLAPWAPSPGDVQVFVADAAYSQLLRVPYIDGFESSGAPSVVRPSVGEVSFEDRDGSGDQAVLEDVGALAGTTATEDWTITWSEGRWWVEGSRSGLQRHQATTGVRYRTLDGGLAFTVRGSATEGDRFTVHTDNGLVELDVGGTPRAIAMAPDQSRLAMIVHDPLLDADRLRWLDPSTDAVTEVPLPADAAPNRMEWIGDRLFVADRVRPSAWEIVPGDPDDLVEHALPWPILDVGGLDRDGGALLYVVPSSSNAVFVLDTATGDLVDVNPTAAGVQGMAFHTAVRGVAGVPVPYRWLEQDESGVALWGRSVAVSLMSGEVVWMEEETGCLVRDLIGPRTEILSELGTATDYITNFDTIANPPYLQATANPSYHVQVNPCAGIAKAEIWILRYDEVRQGWTVTGSVSGEQSAVAHEDERYITDDGALSFVIRAGSTPSQEGWKFQFNVIEGSIAGDGDNDGDSQVDVQIDFPGDPVFFHYRVGPYDGAWRPVDDRPYVLVASEGAEIVSRVKPQNGEIEVVWD